MRTQVQGIFSAILISGVLYSWCAAQLPQVAGEEPWMYALERYSHNDYGAAAVHLQKVLRGGASPYESAALLLLGRSYLGMSMLPKAEEAAQALIAEYPHGRYAPYGHYLLAQIFFLREDFYNSSLQLLEAAQSAKDDDLNLLARTKLERLFEIYLREDQRQMLLPWAQSPAVRAELLGLQQGYRQAAKIGVILPLSEELGNEGQDVLTGIETACAEAHRRARLDVEIVTRDSRGDLVEAIRAAKSLIVEEGIIALLGDLDPSCSAAIAATASEHHIPVIIPAGQDAGLTGIGEDVFQLMADFQIEGAAAAAYALSDVGAKRLAILAPASRGGIERVKGFQSHIERSGIGLAGLQWYYQETTNFRRQLEMLATDEDAEMADTAQTTSLYAQSIPDTLLEEAGDGVVYADTTLAALPINRLQALYLPVQGEEMAYLAPQLAALGFRGSLIGSSVCLDLLGEESNRRYLEGMAFPSNFPSLAGWLPDTDFAKVYQSKTGAYPNRWNAVGWDAFNLLAQALKDAGKLSPLKVAHRLREIRRFQGVRGEIYFPEGERINHALCILKIENGQLDLIKSAQAVAQTTQP